MAVQQHEPITNVKAAFMGKYDSNNTATTS